MSDYIERQAVIDALKQQADTMRTWASRYDEQRRGILTAVNIVEDIEPADVVQVVHARWENYSPITIKCSRCGHVIPDWRYSECKYCPNCGAKMDGERKE